MAPKSVTVELRTGIVSATLPDNRVMVSGKAYAISFSDFQKLSGTARETVFTATPNSLNTIVPAFDGTHYKLDLAGASFHNTVALPPKYTGAPAYSAAEVHHYFEVGDVVQGFNGDAFKLVLLDDSAGNIAATTTKNVAVWIDRELGTVSVDTTTDTGDFAGVFIGAVTHGRYGWVQVAGISPAAAANASVDAGESVRVSTATDGQFISGLTNEVQVITLTSFTGTDSFTITFDNTGSNPQTTAPIVRGTNAADTDVLAALEALSNIAPGDVTVAGTVDEGPYTVSFIEGGAYEGLDVELMTIAGTGCTGVSVATTEGGTATGAAVGTALTDSGTPAATRAEVEIRSTGFANRHNKTRDLFISKN